MFIENFPMLFGFGGKTEYKKKFALRFFERDGLIGFNRCFFFRTVSLLRGHLEAIKLALVR